MDQARAERGRAASLRAWPAWAWAALLLALLVRAGWLGDKPFWRDEAWVAVLARAPLAGFEAPVRPVPIGFLLWTALAARVPAVPAEIGLRLLPLVAGVALVALMPMAARALRASAPAAAAATFLAAGLPPLVYYSRELKPYGLDALVALVVALLAWRAFGPDHHGSERSTWVLGLVVAAAPWLTFGSAFAIAGTLAWAGGRAWRTGPARWWRYLAIAGVSAASFLAAYLLVVHAQATSPRLLAAWGRPGAGAGAIAGALASYGEAVLPFLFCGAWPGAAVLAVIGLGTWPREARGLLAWHVLGTAALTIAASAAGRYVVEHGRFVLFAAPGLILLVAGGLDVLARRLPARAGKGRIAWAGAAVAGAVALAWSAEAVAWRIRPYRNDPGQYFRLDILHDVPSVIAAADRLAHGDPVITSRYSGEQFRFYAEGRLPQTTVCTRTNCLSEGEPMRRWLRSVHERGLMILLEEEDRPWRREAVRHEGFEVSVAAVARGARLWEVTRRSAAPGPPVRGAAGGE